MRRAVAVGLALVVTAVLAPAAGARVPQVLRVRSFNGIPGQFKSIQAAVNVAKPGDWILIAPGDYRERGVKGAAKPAGVLIRTPRLRLRGMNRNGVIVDGTKPGAPPCSARRSDQRVVSQGRNGVVVFQASGVDITNLTVCNFLRSPSGGQGNQIWWNGGDGSGKVGMGAWSGDYITATSTYSKGVQAPYGSYGVFVSNSRGPGLLDHSYASNMADAGYYVGACPDCHAVITHAHGQNSALGFSGTNSGGHLIIENSEFDHNKAGITTNSQNNDDAPSPQSGLCPHGMLGPLKDRNCEVWRDNAVHDNNNPNVPGNGVNGFAGEVPVGTGVVLGGAEYIDVFRNRIFNNDAWGVVVADLPDQETPPRVSHCQGGDYLAPPPSPTPLCYYHAFGNVVSSNSFRRNGSYGNPTNGDIALFSQTRTPGNCFHGNTDPTGLSSVPQGIQASPFNPCGQRNGSTDAAAVRQLICALRFGPCPAGTKYPSPHGAVKLSLPPRQPTMPDPCVGVPQNPWCPRRR